MRRFLTFFALTTATQVCLLAQQVLILPLQIRLWGNDAAAGWFVALALANLASMFDVGLRNAGHAELVAGEGGDAAAQHAFRQTWALARLLLIGLTGLCLVGEMGRPNALLVGSVTVAAALETALIVRGIWFDTLGAFSRVEAVYFGMMLTRIVLSVVALTVLRAPPQTLAWLMIATSGLALCVQARVLRTPALALFAGGFSDIRWRSFGVVGFVVTEPATSWMRFSLPVLVFAAFTPPAFVTSFVALRALFGLARQMVSQLARYASVHYVQRVASARPIAEQLAVRAILASTLIGAALTAVVLVDHGRGLRAWLGEGLLHGEGLALSFGVGAIAYGYQVVAGVLTRSGDLVGVAKRHGAYLLFGGLAALAVRVAPSIPVYLSLLALQELFVAALFIPALGSSILRSSLAAVGVAGAVLGALVVTVAVNLGGIFDQVTPAALAISAAVAAGATAIVTIAMVAIAAPAIRPARWAKAR